MIGRVVKSTGKWYILKDENDNFILSRLKGKIRLNEIKTTNPIAVGDLVEFEIETSGDESIGNINKILKRENYIIRKSNNLSKQSQIIASNIDLALLVISLKNPETSLGFIDRFLVMAGAFHVPVTLVFNKIDLLNPDELNYLNYISNFYKKIGYNTIEINSLEKEKTKKIIDNIILNKTVLLSGHSGVGKSTLLNVLVNDAEQKTNEISKTHLKGKHTTTFAEMFYIDSHTSLIDTPGIRDFGVIEIENQELGHYFPEILKLINQCKYNNCIHVNEPNCVVIKAFENKEIEASRYYNYLSIIENKDIFA